MSESQIQGNGTVDSFLNQPSGNNLDAVIHSHRVEERLNMHLISRETVLSTEQIYTADFHYSISGVGQPWYSGSTLDCRSIGEKLIVHLGMICTNIHLINPGCSQPSIAFIADHHSLIHSLWAEKKVLMYIFYFYDFFRAGFSMKNTLIKTDLNIPKLINIKIPQKRIPNFDLYTM